MTLPEAIIAHRSEGRIRIRLPSRKGVAEYFATLEKRLNKGEGLQRVEVNPLTGSVLFAGEKVDPAFVEELGTRQGLFRLNISESSPVPLSKRIVSPLGALNRELHRFTGGEIDLAGMAFVALLGIGIVQIIRGNFRSPPWYTAFWYALGVFSKALADKKDLT
jgi:hypothetical protein